MIVVAGEALIDLVPLPPGPHPAGPGGLPALAPRPGGGPYNTARALARLGSATTFCSRVSTDGFGEALLAGLLADGVDLSLVQRGPEPTTLAVPSLDPQGSAAYEFYAEGSADRLFALPAELPQQVGALALGTCALVLEPGASAYQALLRREAARGVFTLLDPNIRPALISDPDAYRRRFHGWLPHVCLLKLSTEDAAWLDGSVQDWLAAGPEAVVTTRGAAGMAVHTRDGAHYQVPAAPVEVADTIGAGDTVNAALLHRLSDRAALSRPALAALDEAAWTDVLDYACRAAALACSRAGAHPPYATELE
ncbi:carbohydrate kinase [Streptomyces sp. NPDC006879]|uniref:carbohydrate kinase family protein n=1 Tax=Streptomyces sp. NPDC006879 TaxID=3364767 RepID=UPI0036C7AE01